MCMVQPLPQSIATLSHFIFLLFPTPPCIPCTPSTSHLILVGNSVVERRVVVGVIVDVVVDVVVTFVDVEVFVFVEIISG